jgi:hypothetical protein
MPDHPQKHTFPERGGLPLDNELFEVVWSGELERRGECHALVTPCERPSALTAAKGESTGSAARRSRANAALAYQTEVAKKSIRSNV